jgi:hypothetical protein
MIHNLTRRIDKIEKQVSPEPVCMRLPKEFLKKALGRETNLGREVGNGEFVEVSFPSGCRNLTDIMALCDADKRRKEKQYETKGNNK